MFVCMLCLLVLCALFSFFFTNDNAMISHEGEEGVQGRRRKGELEGTDEQGTERDRKAECEEGCARLRVKSAVHRQGCTGERKGEAGGARAKRGAQSVTGGSRWPQGEEGSARMR